MTVNSNGSDNRIAGRDYQEKNIQIGRYDGSHTVNIAIPSSNNSDPRPLLKGQRKALNRLVAAIVDASNTEAFIIWQKLHAEIGVDSIDDITMNQYKTAESFLCAMLERCKDHDARKALVSILLRNSEDGVLRQKLIRYSHINFGTGRLNDLTRSQLQMALSWLDQQSVEGEKKLTANNSAGSQLQMNFQQIIRKYPKETGMCFVVGVLLGSVLF